MRLDIWKMRFGIRRIDCKRDRAIPLPAGVAQCRNLSYGPHGKWSLLDVYYPEGTQEPMYKFLREKGIDARWHCYGTEERTEVGHVFHVNIRLPEAMQCNDDAAAFFQIFL